MKKTLFILLICAAASIFAFPASAEIYGGKCAAGLDWSLDTETGVLELTGSGFLESYRSIYDPGIQWLNYRDSIKTVKVGEGVTELGACAFGYCTNLTSVSLPSSLTAIGDYAFNSCPKLISITLSDNITELGDWTFSGCYALESVALGNGLTAIGERTFYRCDSLTTLTIPSGVTEIGINAFGYCQKLEFIEVPGGVKYIHKDAFANCPVLGSVIVPRSVIYIGNTAFANCPSIVIYGHEDSLAEEHAMANGLPFVSVTDTVAADSVVMIIGKAFGFVNGEVRRLDVAPVIRNDRTMLPIRFVAEAFGAAVSWDGTARAAAVRSKDVEIIIPMDASVAYVNGEATVLDSPAFLQNDRAYLPVRFVAEALGVTVAWDGVTSTAKLTK